MTQLGERYVDALQYVARLHRHQYRKGGQVPYLAHLLGVCSLVLEHGGDEDQAIAALLHDAAEDQGGRARLEEIERLFGAHVARMVEDCSDTLSVPKPPWSERKQQYVEHLENVDVDTLLISCADKLYNARSIVEDASFVGHTVWQRFSATPSDTYWYYSTLLEVFERRGPFRLAALLATECTAMKKLVRVFDASEDSSEGDSSEGD